MKRFLMTMAAVLGFALPALAEVGDDGLHKEPWMRDTFKDLREDLAEANAEGKLSGLEGEGKPLPDRSSEALVDPALAAGMRIMAQAGVTPPEFPLKQQLEQARAAWREITDPEEKKRAMARIAELEMRYNMARDARRAFLR